MEIAAFNKLSAAIAANLGGAVTRRNDPGNPCFADFRTGEGLPLNVAGVWNDPAKLRVSVILARKGDTACRYLARDLYGRNEVTPDTEIGVSAAKGAEKIAADIRRRLIPGATEAAARANKLAQEAQEYKSGTAVTLLYLSKRLGVEPWRDQNRLRCGPADMEITGPDSVILDRLSLTAEHAAQVIDLLRAQDPDYREGA